MHFSGVYGEGLRQRVQGWAVQRLNATNLKGLVDTNRGGATVSVDFDM